MAKVEVQIRSCFCCGLSVATIFIALYTLLLYSLLTGLAGWGLSDTTEHGDAVGSHYRNCDDEAQGKPHAPDHRFNVTAGHTKIIIDDSTSYHCSFGLYTEELKYEAGLRYMTLMINIFIYVAMILASIVLLIGLAIYNQWLLVPWIIIMAIDIIRGLISVFFIFLFSYWNLARIASGIFFLGLQFFHISLLMIIIAKFQKIYNRKNGIHPDHRHYDSRSYPAAAPAPGSTYAYSPETRRADYYPDQHAPYHSGPVTPYDNHGYRY
ncbi:hypothetical protein WR25_05431 [Diploscapter pachys]|uniref:Uncharacterized protein n=1 Tax=Diploscapter pachys TaxID=2018661 RepID=A0A2A2LKW3_9BILA|nr:hypothetical protein WR25_05431 [Diploscapter pachys]